MFANLIEDLNDGTLDHDYDRREYPSGGSRKGVWNDIAADLDKPVTLTISHVTTGSGDKQYLNTLCRFDAVVERESDQIQGIESIYLVMRTPTKVSDASTREKLANQMLAFLGTVAAHPNVSALLNGEA
jgi:hypothetical protein